MGDGISAPVCTIVAGPNGSGKSTLIPYLSPPGEMVNADEIARLLNPDHPEAASLPAGRAVLARLGELIEQRQSFCWETTLSSQQGLHLMAKAGQAGFQTNLVFVLLEDPALNIARVRSRVAAGGHDIPRDAILRRYEKAFDRLPLAIRLTGSFIMFDNTHPSSLKTLYRIDGRVVQINQLDETRNLHSRLAHAIAAGLGWSTHAVFSSARHGR
jgi:predicted ABC-type ATPase